MKFLRNLSLSGLQLKCIGWLGTVLYVLGIVCFPIDSTALGKVLLMYGGGLAVPIFAFLMVEGFRHTGNLKRYILLILAAAVVTEPFYDYFCTGRWLNLFESNGQNLLFAMVIGLAELYFLNYMGTSGFGRVFACCMMVLASGMWTLVLNIPYGFLFVVFVGIFYLLRESPVKWWLAGLVGILRVSPVLAIPLLLAYDEERGSYNKYLFYIAYPAIWILAALIKLLV